MGSLIFSAGIIHLTMTDATSVTIRLARLEDVQALANLSGQLGYQATVEQVRKRFVTLSLKPEEHAVFVAERNGRVVGWVHAYIQAGLLADPETQIGGLVVEEALRGQRIGAVLMQAVEDWTLKKGCASISLRSNVIRTQAHKFYEQIGYSVFKSMVAFRKVLR
jgi:GNAT superfamily N-acetyltransferase